MRENITSFISDLHRGDLVNSRASWTCRNKVIIGGVFFDIWASVSNSTEDDKFLLKSKI